VAKAVLTTSCTDALEMAGLLLNLKPGDEVIVPSFTFVSSANAFALRGARLVFVDSREDEPNVDVNRIAEVITPKTKAIIAVHYAGFACAMDEITTLAQSRHVDVVEDAAQAVESFYRGRRLGTIGRFGTLSFHETKNLICGEGGLLFVNRQEDVKRTEIIREKGTNRTAFFRGEIAKYSWVDLGSSFLPSELNAAYLFGQLESIDLIQNRRVEIYNRYCACLKVLEDQGKALLPVVPNGATINGHLFYLLCPNLSVRTQLIDFLKSQNIHATFHYVPLHSSEYFSEQLVRLPLFFAMTDEMVDIVCSEVLKFFSQV
jgi:dTDP-4-amino-4,6-dideoxygalactose transaminase